MITMITMITMIKKKREIEISEKDHETNNRPDWPFDVVNRFRNQEG